MDIAYVHNNVTLIELLEWLEVPMPSTTYIMLTTENRLEIMLRHLVKLVTSNENVYKCISYISSHFTREDIYSKSFQCVSLINESYTPYSVATLVCSTNESHSCECHRGLNSLFQIALIRNCVDVIEWIQHHFSDLMVYSGNVNLLKFEGLVTYFTVKQSEWVVRHCQPDTLRYLLADERIDISRSNLQTAFNNGINLNWIDRRTARILLEKGVSSNVKHLRKAIHYCNYGILQLLVTHSRKFCSAAFMRYVKSKKSNHVTQNKRMDMVRFASHLVAHRNGNRNGGRD